MALLRPPRAFFTKLGRPAKAKMEGSSLGPKFIHWEPPKRRAKDTPVDKANKELARKREFDIVMGKF